MRQLPHLPHCGYGPALEMTKLPAALFYRTQDAGRRCTGLQVQAKISFCIAAEYYIGTLTNRFFPRDVWGGGGCFTLSRFSDSKKYRFLQLIICCWLELDMSSRAGRDGIQNRPILVDRVARPRSQKIETI